jgi:hypothetical protein
MDYINDETGKDALVPGFQPLLLSGYNTTIKKELEAGHNVIAHPCVAYTKDFWLKHGPYTNTIPREDFLLWKSSLAAGAKLHIVPEILLHYRIHENQIVAQKNNKAETQGDITKVRKVYVKTK